MPGFFFSHIRGSKFADTQTKAYITPSVPSIWDSERRARYRGAGWRAEAHGHGHPVARKSLRLDDVQ